MRSPAKENPIPRLAAPGVLAGGHGLRDHQGAPAVSDLSCDQWLFAQVNDFPQGQSNAGAQYDRALGDLAGGHWETAFQRGYASVNSHGGMSL